jgi:coronin-7
LVCNKKERKKEREKESQSHATNVFLIFSTFFLDFSLEDLSPSTGTDAQTVAASGTHVAVVDQTANGGNVVVLAANQTGKRKMKTSYVRAHTRQVLDVQFSPFDDQMLATSSDDCTAKVWRVPNGIMMSDVLKPEALLSGHRRSVSMIRWHPTCAGVIATGATDKFVKVWDCVSGGRGADAVEKFGVDVGSGVQGLSWSYDGALLAATSQDKKLRIVDPRGAQVVAAADSHDGVKAQRVVWAHSSSAEQIVTTGFSRMRERQWFVWDARALDKPLKRNTIDSSTGVVTPHYDVDTRLLFLAGKGDSSVRYYELKDKSPYFSDVNSAVHDLPVRSFCALPKRALNVMDTEVVRLLKVTDSAVVPVAFTVPRKSKVNFCDDLFPDTTSNAPSLEAAPWFDGETKAPNLMSLHPDVQQSSSSPSSSSAAAASSSSSPATASSSSPSASSPSSTAASSSSAAASGGGAGIGWKTLQPKVEEKPKEVYKPKVPVNIVRSTHFRHINGKMAMRRNCFENAKAEFGVDQPIKASIDYFAYPTPGPGGRLLVVPLARQGKLPDDFGCVEVGSKVWDFDFSPFEPDVLATGDDHGHVKVWRVSAGLIDKRGDNLMTPIVDLTGHQSRVTTINWHPSAKNVLATSAYDGTIRVWDVSTEGGAARELICLDGVIEDFVQSIGWNYDGTLLAVITKNNELRVIDSRSGKVVQSGKSQDGAKGQRLVWSGADNRIFTAGFSKSSHRELRLWSAADLSAPLASVELDTASGAIVPHYDIGTNVVFLVGRGDGSIHYFEVTDSSPYLHRLGAYVTGEPQAGAAWLPKHALDVKEVEIARCLKLCANAKEVQPTSFFVPRQRREFFQDDVYPPCPSAQPTLTAAQWADGATTPPNFVSLQPAGMAPLSEAPKIERKKKYVFDPNAVIEKGDAQTNLLSSFYDEIVGAVDSDPSDDDNPNVPSDDDDAWSDDDDAGYFQ